MNLDWKDSIYSDGSVNYISRANPQLGETVIIKLRAFSDSPIKKVVLRYMINGVDFYTVMEAEEITDVFTYYKCDLKISQSVINYHFLIGTAQDTYYYNQLEVTNYPPAEEFDFRIIAGYESPEWVKKSVFYQIFPDRFHNGNPDNDVRDNEYFFEGHPTIKKSWGEKTAEYSEAFCLDFYGGDLEGIKEKIPYLKDLGVDALYINPVFYAATHHKYDCMDYFNVDPHLGGNKALEGLVKELHKNDMRIIIDVSINHTGSAHKWFNKGGDFFSKEIGAYYNPDAEERQYYFFGEDNKYDAWFGVETLPTLNYTSDKLRDIIYRSEESVVRKWLKPPYSIDGWRFDVAFCMARKDEIQMHHEIWPEIRKSIKEVNPQAYILAEHWTDNIEFLRGNEWDASMNYFGFGRPVRQFVGEPDEFLKRLQKDGFTSAKRRAEELAKMFMQQMARLSYQIASVQFNMYDSHDIARLHNNPEISYESCRAAVIMQFTFPGTPGIYYGDEINIDGHVQTVEGCRYPMEWNEDRQDKERLHFYKTLARLKREEDSLQTGGFKILYAKDYVLSYARFIKKKAYIVVCSQDENPVKAKIPAGLIGVLDNSRATEVFGRSDTHKIKNNMLEVELKPQESMLFEVVL